MNGADLKIEAPYESQEFLDQIEVLKGTADIKEFKLYDSTIGNGETQIYGQLMTGDYRLGADEAIISGNIANALNVDIGSRVVILGEEYTVSGIEDRVRGVGAQAETMGYAKITSFESKSEHARTVYLINDENYDQIKSELMKTEDSYNYTTVMDVRARMSRQAETEASSLNILNTLSIIMTVLSVMSSIYLVIFKSRQDIAVLKLISISEKNIGKAFKLQFLCLILPSVLLGAGLSIFAAKILLSGNQIDYKFQADAGIMIAAGIVLFSFIYIVYINIACNQLRRIDPLSILKNGGGIGKKGHIVLKGVCFTVFSLLLYAVYTGVNNLFSSSLIIMVLIGIFFILLTLIIKIVTAVKFGKVMNRYFMSHIKEKQSSFCLAILSLSFTIMFFLVGFHMGQMIAEGFSQGMGSKINYNHMLSTGQPESVEDLLQGTEDTGSYTKLNMNFGLLHLNGDSKEQVIVSGIEADKYYVKYAILEGMDVFEGSSEEVLISQELAKKYKLEISDTIEIKSETLEKTYKIKGIYESGGVNENHVLIQNTELEGESAGFMYVASINSTDIVSQLGGVHIVNLQNVSSALEKNLESFLNIFKSLCLICIITSIVFNINIVYMNYQADYKNFVIMRAIGLGKDALYKNVFAEALIMLVLTLLISLGSFLGLVNLALEFMFEAELTITLGTILTPIGIATLILIVIFLLPIRMIQRSTEFTELRELV